MGRGKAKRADMETPRRKASEPIPAPPGTTITDCNFIGIEQASVERLCSAAERIAEACLHNAKALERAACAVQTITPQMEAMLKITGAE